jgi:hypothetical protein
MSQDSDWETPSFRDIADGRGDILKVEWDKADAKTNMQ